MTGASGNTIGWGIIGCGDVVDRKVAGALRAIDGCRIVSAMRRNPEAARAFAERHRVPHWTTDADAVIAHSEVDAIYIATPPANHLEYALAVCAAGKPCVVEKPAGRSEAECRQIVDVFKQAGVPLYVSYYRRYLEKFQRVKQILAAGELGTVVAIHYRMAKPRRAATWRIDPRQSGGGQFYDLGGHVLDLLDDWFGPLELLGSAATNAVPVSRCEDAVALTFRTRDGAIGSATWNFAGTNDGDDMLIEGTFGSMRFEAMSRAGPIRITIAADAAVRASRTLGERVVSQAKRRVHLATRRVLRFPEVPYPHRPLFERVVADLGGGATPLNPAAAAERSAVIPASPAAALRTSALMNAAVDSYYGGRSDAFWDVPGRWRSLRNRASQRIAESNDYRLTPEQVAFFDENGYLGPFECDGDWHRIVVPLRKGRNLHLTEPFVFDLCSHPSIVARAAQLFRQEHLTLFKSRFIVKFPGSNADVAWHQDVGPTNGGYFEDGRPVPTLTCWLALDRVTAENGAVRVVPGTHRTLYGQYHKRIRAALVERGDITDVELDRAVTFELEPGQFYLFHSWLLHCSAPNTSHGRRAGVNMRYAAVGHEFEDAFEYIAL